MFEIKHRECFSFFKMNCILTLILPIFSFGQILIGNVSDSLTSEKLSYVNIAFLNINNGTYTDSEGNYYLNINENKEDTIKVSHIGYEAKFYTLNQFIEKREHTLNIKLNKNENILNEIVIRNRNKNFNKTYKIGTNRKGDITMFSLIGHETTSYIENPLKKEGAIKSIKLYVRKNKKADIIAKFRIKIYSYDLSNKLPDINLLNEDLVISPENKTYQYNLDVENLNIPFFKGRRLYRY